MDVEFKYQGRVATSQDIEFIRGLISSNPNASRRALSQKLCKAWNWVQPNGALQDMLCRSFMLRLESEGHIKLPPRKCIPNNPLANRKRPPIVKIDKRPISGNLSKITPLEIKQVRRSPYEKLFNSLIDQYHYLGYCHPIGEHLKYIIFNQESPIACLAFSSSPRHIGSRDKYIGWSAEIRKKNLHLIAYNTRYLILPWIRVPFIASYILSRVTKILPRDWVRIYNHPVHFIETFVDTEKFRGTSYQAANWKYIGKTTGRGKNDQTNKPNRYIKLVWGYPLSSDFRSVLQQGKAVH